jgi:predicted ATP-grasp superfamily ATP-dependent carboligase
MVEENKEKFIPLQFVAAHGETFDTSQFKGSTLVLPTSSAGMTAMIAAELFISNESIKRVGFLLSEYIAPMVINDHLNTNANAAPG